MTGNMNLAEDLLYTKSLKHLVIGFAPINSRLSTLRVKGRFFNYSTINAHAPTKESSEQQNEDFYDVLEG